MASTTMVRTGLKDVIWRKQDSRLLTTRPPLVLGTIESTGQHGVEPERIQVMEKTHAHCICLGVSWRSPVPLVLVLLVPLLLGAKVKTFASKEHDVTSYSTYEWLPPRVMTRHGLVEDDAVFSPIIKQAINRELARKGYKEVTQGGELQVTSGGFSRTSSQLEGFLVHWGFDYYHLDWGATVAAPVTRVNKEGTLVIVLVDAKTNKGVWGGLATALLGKPESVGKSINKAAKRILKKLPKRED